MAVVAQLVEPRVVISVVVGSSPISRPNFFCFPRSTCIILPFTNIYLFTLKIFAFFGNFLRFSFMIYNPDYQLP